MTDWIYPRNVFIFKKSINVIYHINKLREKSHTIILALAINFDIHL